MFFKQHNKELEKKNILDVLQNIRQRLDSLDQQVESLDGMHEDMVIFEIMLLLVLFRQESLSC